MERTPPFSPLHGMQSTNLIQMKRYTTQFVFFVCLFFHVQVLNDNNLPQLSEGEKAVIAVIATAYLLTALLCLVCIVLILFQQQLKQLHVFYFLMLPLLLSTFSGRKLM
jgi:hypothetical protein